jgi:hypothetical protein
LFETIVPDTCKEVIVAVVACRALAEIPTVNVSKTFAVSAVALLRYKASASETVNEVELVKNLD